MKTNSIPLKDLIIPRAWEYVEDFNKRDRFEIMNALYKTSNIDKLSERQFWDLFQRIVKADIPTQYKNQD